MYYFCVMCGIAGLINFNSSENLLNTIHSIQAHRGPDSTGSWNNGTNVWLGHQRLSIIDLSARSNQPFVKDSHVIVFNGEIYNYKQLKSRLISECNTQFITDGDTEVALEAYRNWGTPCFNMFVGMFAFAIYNVQTRNLVLVRDHFGIKPLFYTFYNNQFAFSSELKSLVSLPGFTKQINSFSLLTALNYQWVASNETMFKNAFKLSPGHFIQFDTSEKKLDLREIEYWQLQPKVEARSEADWIELLDQNLTMTLDRHMVADVPVSSFLSGGLDSSLISVMAAQRTDKLSTFTIATSKSDKMVEQMPDDERYASMLAKKFGFDHHEIEIDSSVVDDLPKMVRTLDEPIGDPAALNTFLICNNARKLGVKVLLSGMGADEIFFGYRRQHATKMVSDYQKLPLWMRKALKSGVDLFPVKVGNKGVKLTRWAKRFLTFADLPIEKAYRRSYSYYDDSEYDNLLIDPLEADVKRINHEHQSVFYAQESLDLENRMCFTDVHLFMLGLNLTYTDRASMAASVEVRVPFIDRPMIELAMSMPGHIKYKNRQSKYILKKAAEKYLPNEIIYRPKASFGAPIRSWISGDLKPLIEDVLSEDNIRKRGLFQYSHVKQMIDLDRSGKVDYAYQLYQLLTIELWMREFYDR